MTDAKRLLKVGNVATLVVNRRNITTNWLNLTHNNNTAELSAITKKQLLIDQELM